MSTRRGRRGSMAQHAPQSCPSDMCAAARHGCQVAPRATGRDTGVIVMARTSGRSLKVAKNAATKPVVAKPVLLSGGNPQIAKGHGGGSSTFAGAFHRKPGAASDHPAVRNHDTDVGFPFSAASLYPLEEDIGPDHDVLSASGAGERGRVNAGGMEGPARDGAVGHRVVALEHRDLGGPLLGEPVPLVAGAIGEACGLTDAVVVDPVVVDVRLVGE